MLTLLIVGFLAAIAAPFVNRYFHKAAGILLALYPIVFFVFLAGFMGRVSSGEAIQLTYRWFPALDINLGFLIDGLSLTFGLIVSGIGAIILYYASGYLHGHPKQGRFYGYLLFFMTSMLGVVLSDNILALFIFWELTSISSYLLIGFNHEAERSRYASLQALIVTGGGGLALMAGLILIGNIGGTYSISELIAQPGIITNHSLYLPILLLVLAGAFTKSAQFPFHFWLPNAMEAPTPVSAYLHSATMVKAGVFLLARFNPLLSGPEIWHTLLTTFGGITMLMGAFMAVGQSDLKRILAYTTVSALGIMVFLIGLGGKYAITAAMTFLVVHALYKGALFLVAGAIDHETGTRDIYKLGGLRKYLPFIFVAAVLAALSYSGIPPFLGFVAKEIIYEATLHAALHPALLTAAAVITNMFLVATAIMVGFKPFFGSFTETPKHPHHAPLTLWLGPVLLGVIGLVLGIFPLLASLNLVGPAVQAVSLTDGIKLSLWHGLTPMLMLSGLTLIGGIAVYNTTRLIRRQLPFFNAISRFGPEEGYKLMMQGLVTFSAKQTRFFQNGYLRNYFYWILTTFMLLVIYTMIRKGLPGSLSPRFEGIYFYEALTVAVMILATIGAILSKTVLSAIASLGVVGYGTALLFSYFSAPDLAFTQFSIETLSVILLVLIVYNVPRMANLSPRRVLLRDGVLSLAAGGLLTLIVMLVLSLPSDGSISSYFLENSYTEAHGRNVVNVILVDFRGLDTMGEITVLTIAAIGVYSLLRFRHNKQKTDEIEHS